MHMHPKMEFFLQWLNQHKRIGIGEKLQNLYRYDTFSGIIPLHHQGLHRYHQYSLNEQMSDSLYHIYENLSL